MRGGTRIKIKFIWGKGFKEKAGLLKIFFCRKKAKDFFKRETILKKKLKINYLIYFLFKFYNPSSCLAVNKQSGSFPLRFKKLKSIAK